MTRKELRTFVKDKFKAQGFSAQKSYLYKIIDDDYLIGFHLDPSSYGKGYRFVCGIIYLPDELKIPLRGVFDLEWIFRFPTDPTSKLDLSNYTWDRTLETVFHYENYSIEQLETFFEINYDYFITPLFDKEYGLEMFRKDWRLMNRFAPKTVFKLCERASIDAQAVFKHLGKSMT